MTFIPTKQDPIGVAVKHYWDNNCPTLIDVISDIAEDEKMDASYFFRNESIMPKLERKALRWCEGRILDIGACVGSHSLLLQQKGYEVTALDSSYEACLIAKKRGVISVENQDFFQYQPSETFDTLLLLMNGVGISGSLDGFKKLLSQAKKLISVDGCIIFDSSDLIYLFMDEEGEAFIDINSNKYYGVVNYQMKFKDVAGGHFDWLFLDPDSMREIVADEGFSIEKYEEGDHYDYLVKLRRKR
ncbi:class I SAM-dependent methyltransferase [Halosquirtibacter xylanolyticus]|uniref:class I SAM-dependent methyltransferase n=1 Tax=Halosquirtibacter xylanolyticus TaxID=3374599 RepID=UPI00374A4C40|nr:class I SAM-dependent methyltransferase [Prolixibacteraceae bacterium]